MIVDMANTLQEPREGLESASLMDFVDLPPVAARPFAPILATYWDSTDKKSNRAATCIIRCGDAELLPWNAKSSVLIVRWLDRNISLMNHRKYADVLPAV